MEKQKQKQREARRRERHPAVQREKIKGRPIYRGKAET